MTLLCFSRHTDNAFRRNDSAGVHDGARVYALISIAYAYHDRILFGRCIFKINTCASQLVHIKIIQYIEVLKSNTRQNGATPPKK